eukprot:Partr_v1_DN28243_c2_g1_i1_m75961 putative EF-hand domain (C-terminal) containing
MPTYSMDDVSKQLPFLPGYRSTSMISNKHNKSHKLYFRDGVRVILDSDQNMAEQRKHDLELELAGQQPSNQFGPHLKDDEVLRFYGYYIAETDGLEVGKKQTEIHDVTLLIYHDDTIQVYEKATANSGRFQGTIIKRNKIPITMDSKNFLTWKDFNIHVPVTLYARVFHITKCDKFTREFYESAGIQVPVDDVSFDHHTQEPSPGPPKEKLRISPAARPPTMMKNFLKKDGQVLRFYGLWDDSKSAYGSLHRLILHYFLADDTIEIREIQAGKAIMNSVPFLGRQRVPKVLPSLAMDGSDLSPHAASEFYNELDLEIGRFVEVYHRRVFLCDCDGFTREYLASNGRRMPEGVDIETVSDFDAETGVIHTTAEIEKIQVEKKQAADEDGPSILPGGRIIPHVRRFGVQPQDQLNCSSRVISSSDPLETERRFVIRLYLVDDTIAIYEKAVQNSGLSSGKFLERGRIKKPGASREYYAQEDFVPHAKLEIYGKTYLIEEFDQYSQQWLLKKQRG